MRLTWVAEAPLLLGSLLIGLSASGGKYKAGNPDTHPQIATSRRVSLDPCQLVTQQQVAAALGMTVDPGKPAGDEPAGSRGCTWHTVYGDSGRGADSIAAITVEVVGPRPVPRNMHPNARSSYYYLRHTLYASDAKDVSGIGDAAFLRARDHWLYAVKGTVLLRVFATFGHTPNVGSVLEQIMKQALSKA
jgi:hypothetical protein